MAITAVACRHGSPPTFHPDRSQYPVRGIDLSHHNAYIDFDKAKADGYEFVILKTTEGTSLKDPRFVRNIRQARQAGLKIGVYHFFRFDTSGYMQGLNLVHSLRGRPLDLPVAIDVEDWTNPTNQPRAAIKKRLQELIDHLQANGYNVMIYTNQKGYDRYIRGTFDTYPLWISALGHTPEVDRWTFWQYSHTGRVKGIDTKVDLNVFAGSRRQWLQFLSNQRVAHSKAE